MWDVSDRLQYSALAAITALVAAALAAWLNREVFPWAAAILVLACSALCFTHAEAFRTQESLMLDTIAKNPLSAGAHNDLGVELITKGRFAKAAQEFQTAVECDPNSADARVNFGHILSMAGKLPEARRAQFQAALVNPTIRKRIEYTPACCNRREKLPPPPVANRPALQTGL